VTRDRLRVVVSGLIVQYPIGGMIWHYLQYLLGFRDLGHDVTYIEDNGQWPYDPSADSVSVGCDHNVARAQELFARHRIDAWAYRFPGDGAWYGSAAADLEHVLGSADLLVNVSGSLDDPSAFAERATKVYVDTDPVFTQIRLARGEEATARQVLPHHLHLTFGETLHERFGSDVSWLGTRQPIALDQWHPEIPPGRRWTTVMNWTSVDDVELDGRSYGQKDHEFTTFEDLAATVRPVELEVAIAAGVSRRPPLDRLRRGGWRVVDPGPLSVDELAYRAYVEGSRAEWSVAKQAYVSTRSGWFSERSACYLAAGRPVVLQDTGFSDVLPTGAGLIAFSTLEQARAGIEAVETDLGRHRAAARELAAAHFDAATVLGDLVDRAARICP
jgi:hypothetical protein